MQSDQRVAQFATRTMRIFRSSPDWTDRRVLCLASLIFNPALLSEPPKFTPFKPIHPLKADLEFVKKITRPNFGAKEFYTLKTRKL